MNGIDREDYDPEVREPAGYRKADKQIAFELRECLAEDAGLDASQIEVEVSNGEVTLNGTVRHCADMQRAEGHACAILGVLQVRNNLRSKKLLPGPTLEENVGAAAKMGKPDYER